MEDSKFELRPRKLRFSMAQAQSSYIEPPDNSDSIVVYARMKPSTDDDDFLRYDDNVVCYDELDKRGRQRTLNFTFHKVFKSDTTQEEIYDKTVDNDITMFIKGHNRLLFSYGTTGSGKTYTILGTTVAPGILPRCTVKLFLSISSNMDVIKLCPDQGGDLRELSEHQMMEHVRYKQVILALLENVESDDTLDLDSSDVDFKINKNDYQEVIGKMGDMEAAELDMNVKCTVWVSYLEVYNENIYDLLDINMERKPLKLGMDSEKNNFVKGLTHVVVETWMEMWKIFLYGRARVHMNQTQLNKNSSRSHSIFTVKLVKTSKKEKPTVTCLTICDLAGTERQKKALNSGDKLNESKHINTSLMILNRCFSIVRENKTSKTKKIAPYRESKLTQIFQKAFSYNERITMFVNLSMSKMLGEESKNVLKMSAVAQEMVKSMPTKRFLKPNSRFSMMCQNNDAPSGLSGVFTMTNSSINSNNISDETVRKYQETINDLKKELQASKTEIKSLMETVEDARIEYLNLEKKVAELEEHLGEEEAFTDQLQTDNEDLQMVIEARNATMEKLEAQLEKEKEHLNDLLDENADLKTQLHQIVKEKQDLIHKSDRILKEKNDLIDERERLLKENNDLIEERKRILQENNHSIEERDNILKDKGQCLELKKNTLPDLFAVQKEDDAAKKEKKPKRKELLKTLDPIDRWSNFPEDVENTDTTKSAMQSTSRSMVRTPRSTRKTKLNYAE